MKKAEIVIALAFTLFVGLFVALPVMAAPPPEEQKVPVTLKWTNVGPTTTVIRDVNGNVSHRIITQNWAVKLFIGESITPIEGTAVSDRQTLYIYGRKPNGVDQIANDHYVISFPGGGFEGNTHITITDWDSALRTYNVHLHAVFQGAGAFEGQTINAWQIGPGTNFLWEGYLLKP